MSLRSDGHEAQHVRDVGLGGTSDDSIWQYASVAGLVIVTKDSDFVFRQALDPAGPQVIRLRLGDTRKVSFLAIVSRALPALVAALERGDRLVQLTRNDDE
jgi:predicted nuclease of predicted toxin-antitoxin system